MYFVCCGIVPAAAVVPVAPVADVALGFGLVVAPFALVVVLYVLGGRGGRRLCWRPLRLPGSMD